jgi:hypothetical protein
MFEWPWTKAKRKREEERRRAQVSYGGINRASNPYWRTSTYSTPTDDNSALLMTLHAHHLAQSQTPAYGSYTPPSEPDRSGDYGTRDHTGFKTGGGFGGESNHYGGSMESSYSSSSDSSSSYSSDSSSSSDSGGGGSCD